MDTRFPKSIGQVNNDTSTSIAATAKLKPLPRELPTIAASTAPSSDHIQDVDLHKDTFSAKRNEARFPAELSTNSPALPMGRPSSFSLPRNLPSSGRGSPVMGGRPITWALPNNPANNTSTVKGDASMGRTSQLKHPLAHPGKLAPIKTATSVASPYSEKSATAAQLRALEPLDSRAGKPGTSSIHVPNDHGYPMLTPREHDALSPLVQVTGPIEKLRKTWKRIFRGVFPWSSASNRVAPDVLQPQLFNNSNIAALMNAQSLVSKSNKPGFPDPAVPSNPVKSGSRLGWNVERELQKLTDRETNYLLLFASRMGNRAMVRLLLQDARTFDVNVSDDDGRTPLMFAAIGGHPRIAKDLLKAGALLPQTDQSGRCALHWAAHFGHAKVIRMLLDWHARQSQPAVPDLLTMADYQGKLPIHCAATSSSYASIDALMRRDTVSGDLHNRSDHDQMTPLMWACTSGHSENVQALLRSKTIDLYRQDNHGRTALHWTITNKHTRCIARLLLHTPKLASTGDISGRSALHLACMEGNTVIAYYLALFQPGLVASQDAEQRMPLHWACLSGRGSIVHLLVDLGAPVHCQDLHLAEPLHYAALHNHQDCVHVLLRKGAAVEHRDIKERTPLHWAAMLGHVEIVKLLVLANADIHCQDHRGFTPLHFAAAMGHTATCLLLLKQPKADPNIRDRKHQPPLFRAAMQGRSETVLALLNEGADLHAKDETGRSCLHWAALGGCWDSINILVGSGAVVDGRDEQQSTALHEAALHGRIEICQYLLDHGADVNARDRKGTTPLHWAALRGHLHCCRLLLQHQAEVNATVDTPEKETPLDFARFKNKFDCAQFLKDHGAHSGKHLPATPTVKVVHGSPKPAQKDSKETEMKDFAKNK